MFQFGLYPVFLERVFVEIHFKPISSRTFALEKTAPFLFLPIFSLTIAFMDLLMRFIEFLRHNVSSPEDIIYG